MGKVPSYRHHKARNLAVVRIGGRDHYLGKFGSPESKKAYKRLIREWESAGRGHAFGIGKNQVTIAILWSDYREYCDQYYPAARNSEAVQTRAAFVFMEDYLDSRAADFGPLKLKAVRDAMLKAPGAHGKPLSRKYVNKQIDRIRRAFKWAVANELIEPSVYAALREVAGLKKGRTTAPEPPRVTGVLDSTIAETLTHCSTIVADMVRLQRLTGMRPGEVVKLTPEIIDRSGEVWLAKLTDHKTAYRGAERIICFGPRAQILLSKYLLRPENAALFSPREAEAERRERLRANRVTPLNCGNSAGTNVVDKPKRQPGTHYTTASYGKAIRYACSKQWPIPEGASKEEEFAWRERYWWSPNQIRHTAATLARKEHGIEAAQVLLGHSEIAVTQVYAERNLEAGIKIASLVG